MFFISTPCKRQACCPLAEAEKIVDEERYDTVDALRAISAERWSSMHIPGRFVDAINRRLGSSCATALTEELSGLTLRVGHAKYGLCDGIEDVPPRTRASAVAGAARRPGPARRAGPRWGELEQAAASSSDQAADHAWSPGACPRLKVWRPTGRLVCFGGQRRWA